MTYGAGSRALKNLIGVVIAVLVVGMVALLARLVFEFFGALHGQPFYAQLVSFTNLILLPIQVSGAKTPYAGVFDVRATLTIVVLLVGEYLLTGLRKRV